MRAAFLALLFVFLTASKCRESLPSLPPVEVRKPALAGGWYDAEADALRARVTGFIDAAAQSTLHGYPIALIVPHAGYVYSGATAAHAYRQLQGRTYGRVFVVAPSHRAAFDGVCASRYTHYTTPLGNVNVDTVAVRELLKEPGFSTCDAAEDREHAIEIQIPLLQVALGRFLLVPLMVSDLDEEGVAGAAASLRRVIRPGDLYVASSDFTHYGQRFGYFGPPSDPITPATAAQKLPALLARAWSAVETRDVSKLLAYERETHDSICGLLPIAILLSVLPPDTGASLLATQTSGALTGDWDNSVSYLAAAFTGLWPYSSVQGAQGLSEAEKAELLKLARAVVNEVVSTGRVLTAQEAGVTATPRLSEKSGAFVTLKKEGDLRGCIGTIPPVKPLVRAVIDNAVNAALNDGRFEPVAPAELPLIEVEVSVLTPPVPVKGYEDIVLGRDGVILEKNGRMALFLPQVAPEQGWTLADTLTHLSLKARLPADAWKSGASFEVFEAIVFHEQK
jgi:AmmeMemoRadiSam system protein B/AmmeMemoRadiSam system protein A